MSFQEYLQQGQVSSTIQAPPPNPTIYRGLALEGGGVCGIGHLGVIQYLEETNQLLTIDHFAGTSAGAIVAGLLACRMPFDKLLVVMNNLDFRSFENSDWFILGSLYRVWSEFGLNPGTNIALIYGQILMDYLGTNTITLGQIRAQFGTTLVITTTSWTTGQTIYLNPDDHPEMTLVEAVQSSASYPLEYTPYASIKDLRLDGGLLDNYPIRILRRYLSPEQIIGSKLVSSDLSPSQSDLIQPPEIASLSDSNSFDQDGPSRTVQPFPHANEYPLPTSLTTFINGLIRIYQDMALRVHVHSDDWTRTIQINIGTISCFDLDLSDQDKTWLIRQGYLGAKQFFEDIGVILN